MKFFKSLLILFFVFVFISCELEPDHRYKRNDKFDRYEPILILHLHRTIKNYRETVDLLKEEKASL